MEDSSFTIREASAADAEELSRFASQAFLDAYSGTMNDEDIRNYIIRSFKTEEVFRQLLSPDVLFHLATDDARIAGYTKLRWDRTRAGLDEYKAIELERIYVAGGHYRAGLGTVMFNNVLSVARSKGYDLLWLAVWQQNQRAISFYKKAGMEIFGVQEFTVGTIVNNDYVFKLAL